MQRLQDAKLLGGLGSLLPFLTVLIPHLGLLSLIIGPIMVLIAVKHISDVTGDKSIFNSMIYSVIASVVGVGISFFVVFIFGISAITAIERISDMQRLLMRNLAPFLTLLALIIISIWIAGIVSAIFLRRSFDRIAELMGVSTFKTTGTIALIGACTIIILIGILIEVIAVIFQALSFFSLPEEYLPPPPPARPL